jgi:hypothetical protein
MNLFDMTREFRTDDECLEFLEKQRWPDGIHCPTCGCDRISKVTRKKPSKNVRTRIYQCLEKTCKGQFSATNGSIFHDSHLSLVKWFTAIAIMVDAKKGISAKQLQMHLGIKSYKTAWYMCHRIRKSMIDQNPTPMVGKIEIDETYLGGKAIRKFKKHYKPRPAKDIVLAIRERSTNLRDGRVRFFHIPDATRETLQPIIEANIQPFPQRIVTDESSVYGWMFQGQHKKVHRTVNHSKEWIVPGTRTHTNTVESAFSLLKRGIIGSFHQISAKHLHRYLAEFECRFNIRRFDDRFIAIVSRMMQTQPMSYRALTAGEL